jgi:ATP-dependent DNA helicase RecG
MAQKKHPLSVLGVTSDAEIVLLMPDKYMDCRSPESDYRRLQVGREALVRGEILSEPTKRWPNNKKVRQPLFIFDMHSEGMTIQFVVFGDCTKLIEQVVGAGLVHFHGTVSSFGSQLQLQNAVFIDHKHVGKVLPFYPGTRGAMKAERVTSYVRSRFPKSAKDGAALIRKLCGLKDANDDRSLFAYADTHLTSLDDLLWMTHSPRTPEEALHAQNVWHTISALYVAKHLHETAGVSSGPEFQISIDDHCLEQVMAPVPFQLVDDQITAVKTLQSRLNEPERTHHLINGDVGSGKTITFLITAVAAARSGARVAIMAPNGPLAKQIYRELGELWPDVSRQFVNGDTPKDTPITSSIVVGTQALCFRLGPNDGFNLVIIDEQQRYSVEQREGFMSSHGNLIEATATCIPRTMALLQFGNIGVSVIATKHSGKTIHTRLLGPDDSRLVFGQVKAYLQQGDRVLVVYPLKEGREVEGEEFDKESILESFNIWERQFPGQVHMLHGDMKEDVKTAIIDDLKAQRKSLLISTTVVEVGINIPDLKYCVVVNPDRAGLVTLHQIRGRLVRNGGIGLFDMFCLDKISAKTQKRLNVLVKSNDGFEIAEEDLKLRGAGDLKKNSQSQSGKSNGLLLNQAINVEYVKFFLEVLKESRRTTSAA